MKLWVDDLRCAPPGWIWVINVEDAKAVLETGEVEELSLDHDLGDTNIPERTGYTLVCWMEEKHVTEGIPFPPICRVHSDNSVGVEKMRKVLQRYGVFHY